MGTLHAELVARPVSRADFARLAAAWLTNARRMIFPELDPADATEPEPSGARPEPPSDDGPWGRPGTISMRLRVQHRAEALGGTLTPYSARTWRRTLAGLERSYPFHLSLAMMPLGPDGRPISAGPDAVVAVHRSHRDPRWTRFEAEAPEDLVAWARSPAAERAWADFLREQAVAADAQYGHLTDDANNGGTALERAIQGIMAEPPAVPRCRDVLRGYSWVTVCARPLAARLGGAPALRADTVFDEVTELPGGQVFLRATAALEDYEGPAVRRAFEALAPVLLPGRPDAALASGLRARLVLDTDAADYQQ